MAESNAINAATTGIVGNTGTSFTGTAVTQYNVITGASTTSTLNNVAPSATSGVPLISQGSSAQPIFGTAAIAGGGTNATSFGTTHGTVVYDGTRLVNYAGPQISTGGIATNTSQPCFYVYMNSTTSALTGDGTVASIQYDTTLWDNGSNITLNSSGKTIFTAPVTGKYWVYVDLNLQSLTSSHTAYQLRFVATSRTLIPIFNNYFPIVEGTGVSISANSLIDMSANDTIYTQIYVAGGTKAVTISGSNTSTFQGFLVC